MVKHIRPFVQLARVCVPALLLTAMGSVLSLCLNCLICTMITTKMIIVILTS